MDALRFDRFQGPLTAASPLSTYLRALAALSMTKMEMRRCGPVGDTKPSFLIGIEVDRR